MHDKGIRGSCWTGLLYVDLGGRTPFGESEGSSVQWQNGSRDNSGMGLLDSSVRREYMGKCRRVQLCRTG